MIYLKNQQVMAYTKQRYPNPTLDFPTNFPSLDEAVSEVVPSLCKGGLGRVDHVQTGLYPLFRQRRIRLWRKLPLTKGEDYFGNSLSMGEGIFAVGFGMKKKTQLFCLYPDN
jgi:hypothetical protein